MTAIVIGVLAGGRLGYMLLYDLPTFLQNPLTLLRVDQGGHGQSWWLCRRDSRTFWLLVATSAGSSLWGMPCYGDADWPYSLGALPISSTENSGGG